MRRPGENARQYPAFFTWRRANGGYVIDKEAALAFPNATKPVKRPFLRESADTTGYVSLRPLDDECELFVKFAKTPNTEKEIISFANEHGMLKQDVPIVTEQVSEGRGKERKLPVLFGEPLDLWDREIWDMKVTFQVWEWLQAQDEERLNLVIDWSKGNSVSYLLTEEKALRSAEKDGLAALRSEQVFFNQGIIAGKEYFPDIFSRFRKGDTVLPARYLIQQRVNNKLEANPTIVWIRMNENSEHGEHLMPKNLLAAMWFQFYLVVTGAKRFKRCAICCDWADVSDKNKNWTMHPECSIKERVRKYRAKLPKSKAKGKS